MPLPKIPTKPAALLAPADYTKADQSKIVKALVVAVEPVVARIDTLPKPAAREKPAPLITPAKVREVKAVKPVVTKPKS